MGQPSRGGRPRSRDIDEKVLSAVASVLDASGYGAVAVEDVARRAGVSKTAVYRRWPDRPRLVLGALRQRMAGLFAVDTGCTLWDLHEVLTMTTGVFCTLRARDPGSAARRGGRRPGPARGVTPRRRRAGPVLSSTHPRPRRRPRRPQRRG